MDIDPVGQVVEAVERSVEVALSLLPQVLLALVVLALFVVVARVVRRRAQPRLARARTPSFGRVFATLLHAAIVVAGVFVALTIAFPSVNPATMLGGLGLLGVAAGFAFQDILSNLLAGVLLLLRQPFVGGDQIEVNGIRGTVEAITIRETRLRTFDGRLVLVPNADVYTNAIEVQTHFGTLRSNVLVGVAYGADLSRARELALELVSAVDGVLADPAPEAYYLELGASAVDLDVRFWTEAHQAELRSVRDRVVQTIHDGFEEAGIDIPFDIVTLDAGETFTEAVSRRTGT